MRMGSIKFIAISLLLIFSLLSFLVVFEFAMADTCSGPDCGLDDPLKGMTLSELAQKITGLLLTISIPIASIMVLVGGFQIMTAGGDPAKASNGKKTILYTAIGFVVVLLADTVPTLLQNLFE